MKRIILIVVMLSILIFGVVFYVIGGQYLLNYYRPLVWKDVKTVVPKGFQPTEYESNGWQVIALRHMGTLIKIALQAGVDVNGLAAHEKRTVLVKKMDGTQPSVVYLVEKKNLHTISVATEMEGMTVYVSVASMSLLVARHIMQRMLSDMRYRGAAVSPFKLDFELKYYRQDLFLAAALLLPILIIVVMFIFPGRAPEPEFFQGEAVLMEEKDVYGTFIKGLGRSSNFYYMAITNSRLFVFFFKKPRLEIDLLQNVAKISIEGKKIILIKDNMKVILRPENIERWRPFLSRYITG